MLSSMDSWLAWRTVLLGISTARPVSVLLWMAPFSLRPSPSREKGRKGSQLLFPEPSALTETRRSRKHLLQDQPGICHATFLSLSPASSAAPKSPLEHTHCSTTPDPADTQSMHNLPTYPKRFYQLIIHWAGSHTSWLHPELPRQGTQQQQPRVQLMSTAWCLQAFPKSHVAASGCAEQHKEWQVLVGTKWAEGRKRPGSTRGAVKAGALPDQPQRNSWAQPKCSLVALESTSSGKPWRGLFPLVDALSHCIDGIK